MGNYGGYDGNVFHNFWGFSRWSGFPTTGFQNAAFTAIGPGANQLYYRCYSHNGGGKIWLSTINGYGANCTVNYAAEKKWQFIQNGTPVITMEYFNGRDWIWMDSFTIPVPSKWPSKMGNKSNFTNQVILDGMNEPGDRNVWNGGAEHGQWVHVPKTIYYILDYCSGRNSNNVKRRTQTAEAMDDNFRRGLLYTLVELKGNNNTRGFVRGLGNFMGEWGALNSYNSLWGDKMWTADRNDAYKPFYVQVDGYAITPSINRNGLTISANSICRGD
ncbi:hypothetical protein B6C88_07945 [Gilliamella apis]|nr:hypothetical protein B6C88_07945 [Gilliamella apis]